MPSRYMELIWSTATFKPLKSKIWSVSLVWFSNAMWYWKPEQPPPTTATRSATGTGLCMFMFSLTLVLATGVRLIIFFLASIRRYTCELPFLHIIANLPLFRTMADLSLRSALETPAHGAFRQGGNH